MTVLVLLVAVVVGAVFQATLPTISALGSVQVPVMTGIVIYYALMRDRAAMLTAAIVAGLVEDAMGLMPLGYSSFCCVVVGLLARHFKETVMVRHLTTHILFGAAANGFVAFTLAMILGLNRIADIHVGWAVTKIVGAVIAGAIVVPMIFQCVAYLDRMVGNIAMEEA